MQLQQLQFCTHCPISSFSSWISSLGHSNAPVHAAVIQRLDDLIRITHSFSLALVVTSAHVFIRSQHAIFEHKIVFGILVQPVAKIALTSQTLETCLSVPMKFHSSFWWKSVDRYQDKYCIRYTFQSHHHVSNTTIKKLLEIDFPFFFQQKN